MIIDTEKRTHESQDFAKCDKNRGVDDTERWHDEAGDKQTAPDDKKQQQEQKQGEQKQPKRSKGVKM